MTECQRKTVRAGEAVAPPVEEIDGVGHVRALEPVRQVLRAGGSTTQAGFNAESARSGRPKAHPPVLFQDGDEHKAKRKAIARYFAPATVDRRYRELMEELADRLVAEILQEGRASLSDVTMTYSVEVAAQVVGLTESDLDGMTRRLNAFFAMPPAAPDASAGRFGRLVAALKAVRSIPTVMAFDRSDVRPAIAARRVEPRDDVISHLISQDYTDEEILVECITYAAAGMITTREFISMATWHLLEQPSLRDAYLAAEQPERYDILDEILRLEPVVGHLYRRTTEPLTLTCDDSSYAVPAGAVLDLYIRAANADESAVGPQPLTVCPGRETAAGLRPEAMSFGDGNHMCPGNAIATQESDIFLTRLLRPPLRLDGAPRIEWDELIKGYAVRDLVLVIADEEPPSSS
ncbi:cytochrome P450 [Arsenicicoccus sp. oral taxon 190]|uniref:cytochrome P450 n=1 Tax=Arsenicicoccus sp. oral taxon 190 TaxID=1658671 RepID=UPI00067A2795|nr:cytochrome P450 [Arsenicicoccus sp. oral taxon 190]AKT51934.1 cytochrome P450 [Arsenicicoccus sp. oral taxon 190]